MTCTKQVTAVLHSAVYLRLPNCLHPGGSQNRRNPLLRITWLSSDAQEECRSITCKYIKELPLRSLPIHCMSSSLLTEHSNPSHHITSSGSTDTSNSVLLCTPVPLNPELAGNELSATPCYVAHGDIRHEKQNTLVLSLAKPRHKPK